MLVGGQGNRRGLRSRRDGIQAGPRAACYAPRVKALIQSLCLLTLLCGSSLGQEAREIFDGKTLKGWEGEPGFWTVERGELVGRTSAEQPLARSTWLIWRGGELRDFRLDLDYRLIGGNSGVQFRSRDLGSFQVGGYQADLEDGPNWSGCLYEQEGRGVCARRGESVRFDADGSRTALEVADPAALMQHVHTREWNHYTIVARGPSLSFAINGVPMTSVTDLDATRAAATGILALQLHQGPPMEVRFKNLRLIEYGSASSAVSADPNAPQWIWTHAGAAAGKQGFFEKSFDLGGAPRSARLAGCADNQFEVWVNGAAVLDHDEWSRPVWVDVAKHLRAQRNTLSVRVQNDGGPAAMQLALDIETDEGKSLRIVSDESWSASESVADAWSPADGLGVNAKTAVKIATLGGGVWNELPEPVPFAPLRALAAEELKLPAGFRAELLYSVPRRTQGSWVSMCFDDRGRIIASDQYGPLYRVTLKDGEPVQAEELELKLGSAQGLCFAFDALYVVVSESGEGYEPGLYRAKYDAAADRFEPATLLAALDGNGEHGPHAVVLAPDGRSLYVVGGNHTKLPASLASSRVAQCWAEDQLLPQHADPNGHAVGITAPGGWICKTDPEGKQWELLAAGFRNSYDMAFDRDGEAFTFDSDMEWDMGLPWYRPTMIEHVVSGGDYGWRTGSWRWPAHYTDSLPGAVDIGPSSPTGMCSVPDESGFALADGARLLVGDWAYGTIYSVALKPQGASFVGSFAPFVQGKPLPVTDMEFGPDAALYFLVGGRRTQSALYRVSSTASAASGKAPAQDPQAARLVAERKQLERLHAPSSPGAVDAGFASLDSPDRFVRFAARAAIEHQEPQQWLSRALTEQRPWARVEALMAVARRAPPELRDRALDRFGALELEKQDDEHLLASLRALQLVCIRLGPPAPARAQALARRLGALYPHANPLVDRELCQLLVHLEAPDVVAKTLDLIDQSLEPAQQIALAWSLRNLKSNWSLGERVRFFRWMNLNAIGWSGGLSFTKYLDHLREDAIATLSEDERAKLGGLMDKPSTSADATAVTPRALVEAWSVDRLLATATRARSGRDFERGKRIYREARCFECHRIAGSGGGSGPDLTGVGNRFGDRDLLESLIEPSKTVSDQYQDMQVLTKDDELFVGRLERRPNGDVRVWSGEAKEPVLVLAAQVESVQPAQLSRMPAGLLDSFHEDELADLLAYLRSGANPKDGAFARGQGSTVPGR